MTHKLKRVLQEKQGNYILPFFWQHGETEEVLREYMSAIDKSNIKAVCIESRPHPDFCGVRWWHDMDIILDEARKRDMRVWILDDSHFPTGFANGALKSKADHLCRQFVVHREYGCHGGETFTLNAGALLKAEESKPSDIEVMIAQSMGAAESRCFQDDRLLGVLARNTDGTKEIILAGQDAAELKWDVPEGDWKVYVLQLTRNAGYHRDYINMLDQESCHVLIESVYEKHWEKYQEDFGKTIAGFFSDEPELGNGHMYDSHNAVGIVEDLPWSMELETNLKKRWGTQFLSRLSYLWEDTGSQEERKNARYDYMDEMTRLVEKNFSMQIGQWCRDHHVQYIGHMIEDNDQHAHTGSSLGHFFRGLAGQDMAGIDDIGGQVFPQGEDVSYDHGPLARRDGEFYHFMLGKLGSSAAAIDPLKKGRSMCEIFGNYGWSEGVRLEKYLLDHFLVRGINHFVPHAFSPKEFPDPDCPPHFYAHGNNPQYRHFGELMKYTNRICELQSDGRHAAPVAVIYHAEGEWTGDTMHSHKIGRLLTEAQIDFDYIPMDVFLERDKYQTRIVDRLLRVNTQEYQAVIVPDMPFEPLYFQDAAEEMRQKKIPVLYAKGVLEGMVSALREICGEVISIEPSDAGIRYYQYEYEDGNTCLMLVNEGTKEYRGQLSHQIAGRCAEYDPWNNLAFPAEEKDGKVRLNIHPLQCRIFYFDTQAEGLPLSPPENLKVLFDRHPERFEELPIFGTWERSICRSRDYPAFAEKKEVYLPDNLWEEKTDFSGFVKYRKEIEAEGDEEWVLYISDAYEGMEVFVNGESLGIQCVPPFIYIPGSLRKGTNEICIEVATTLERELSNIPDMFGQIKAAEGKTGITGEVKLYKKRGAR